MLVKIHKSYRDVVGKSFEKGNAILEVKENFYNGDEVDEKKALSIMQFHIKEDATFNIVGKKSIALALKTGIISKEGIKTIQGIPYALVLM